MLLPEHTSNTSAKEEKMMDSHPKDADEPEKLAGAPAKKRKKGFYGLAALLLAALLCAGAYTLLFLPLEEEAKPAAAPAAESDPTKAPRASGERDAKAPKIKRVLHKAVTYAFLPPGQIADSVFYREGAGGEESFVRFHIYPEGGSYISIGFKAKDAMDRLPPSITAYIKRSESKPFAPFDLVKKSSFSGYYHTAFFHSPKPALSPEFPNGAIIKIKAGDKFLPLGRKDGSFESRPLSPVLHYSYSQKNYPLAFYSKFPSSHFLTAAVFPSRGISAIRLTYLEKESPPFEIPESLTVEVKSLGEKKPDEKAFRKFESQQWSANHPGSLPQRVWLIKSLLTRAAAAPFDPRLTLKISFSDGRVFTWEDRKGIAGQAEKPTAEERQPPQPPQPAQ